MSECTLHNLLTSCQYPQVFWIYQTNDYDENILLTKGTKQEKLDGRRNQLCAEDHRQLAEWLRELQKLREGRPQGRWKAVKASIYPYGYDVKCSVCGFIMGSSYGFKYCPHCGAYMKGEQDE